MDEEKLLAQAIERSAFDDSSNKPEISSQIRHNTNMDEEEKDEVPD